jgi:alanyl-tRNA synthetase
VTERVKALQAERRELADRIAELEARVASSSVRTATLNGGKKYAFAILRGTPSSRLPQLVDEYKTKVGSGFVVFITELEGKVGVAAGVTEDLKDKVSAKEIVAGLTPLLGGNGGGGRDDFAQGGGKDLSRKDEIGPWLTEYLDNALGG